MITYYLQATTTQMAVIMLYNENTEMTLQHICDSTKLRHEVVAQIAQALVKVYFISKKEFQKSRFLITMLFI